MDRYRIAEGAEVDLSAFDPDDTSQFDGGKKDGVEELKHLRKKLADLQYTLYADDSHRLLVVLQAMDAGGKDGTIRKVFKGVNPQGVHVVSFKKPSEEELARDYLWRIHEHVPSNGDIAVFNRSHYEDVLAVRVGELVPEERWRRRYAHIRDFERLLVDEGTTVVKFYLHISREEQAERLQERLDDPTKRWKFNPDDLKARKDWAVYMDAFEDAIAETSTETAPWYVVPANKKWYRNIVIARVLIAALEAMDLKFPEPHKDLDGIVIN